ncbi:MAG: glucan biosynthesis protein [Alphaproteobacteria bacterium]|nr:glucan biosynthesis protein [Alphaproteobacteria bacterium]
MAGNWKNLCNRHGLALNPRQCMIRWAPVMTWKTNVPLSRRHMLGASLPWTLGFAAAVSALAAPAGAKKELVLGPARPFNFDLLRVRAQELSRKAYVEPRQPAPDIVRTMNFDVSQRIQFRPGFALWKNGPPPLPVRFFPVKQVVPYSVNINALAGGTSRDILYRPSYFDWNGTGLDKRLPHDLGFSGFRVMNGHDVERDWLAFQGASYFRASGSDDQYGASARGIAVNTSASSREEFPIFSEFWIGEDHGGAVTVYALLEGRSITGAYRFTARRDNGVIMDIHADLFARADIERLGIAPLTSMFWYNESNRLQGDDWRPQIHDSDGLALWTGSGERIWRPLVNPPTVQANSFVDDNPKGFGLMQRDRDFNDYQDDGTFYNKRPSMWVEPRGKWGEGAVQLVEIPTDDETHDNIVAYWLPKQRVSAGTHVALDYRLYWQDPSPFLPRDVGYVVATRIGRGGIVGGPAVANTHKFVIDFEGGPLTGMAPRYDIVPVVTLSRGKVVHPYVIKVVGTERWRAVFDVMAGGPGPLNMRCYLRLADKTLSETWLYQYFPPAH